MKQLIIGIIVGLLIVPAMAALYVWFGYAPVATAAPPFPFEKLITRTALNARIAKEAPKSSPVPSSTENLSSGAAIYEENCLVCHGSVSGTPSPTAKGMFPPPPQLLHGKGVTDDPVGETYWKVANGIRLTGMPAYRGSLSDEQLWQVSELLATANQLPDSVRTRLAARAN